MFQSYQAVGRLTRDTEVRDAGEHKVGDFGIAINGFKDEVLFLNCQTWNKQAESLAAYTKKGDKIMVAGELKEDKWEDDDGNKRSKMYLNANRIVFLKASHRRVQPPLQVTYPSKNLHRHRGTSL